MTSLYKNLKRFEVYSGGYMGPSFSVEKDGDVLIYKTYGEGYSIKNAQKIKLSPKKWKKISDVCNEIGIWEWKPRYENPEIMDGSSWRVFIELADIKLDSSGSNDGPDNLDILLKSVRELLGGADFY